MKGLKVQHAECCGICGKVTWRWPGTAAEVWCSGREDWRWDSSVLGVGRCMAGVAVGATDQAAESE